MKVSIPKDALAGDIEVPAGDYMVAIAADTGSFTLTGRGRTFKIPATKRRNNGKQKGTSVSFFNAGGTVWSLVYQSPKLGEWVAMLDVDTTKKKQEEKKK
jgi:hypothetical protein